MPSRSSWIRAITPCCRAAMAAIAASIECVLHSPSM
jgi:hypothetical protein